MSYAINTATAFGRALLELTGQYGEEKLERVIARTDPKVFSAPGVMGAIANFLAQLDPDTRMAAFTFIGTMIKGSNASMVTKLALGSLAMAIPPGIEQLMERNDLTADDLRNGLEIEVQSRKDEIGALAAYCGIDPRAQIHLQDIDPIGVDNPDPSDWTFGTLEYVTERCWPTHNMCRHCFPSITETKPASAAPEEEPDPLNGLAAFEDKRKAAWVQKLHHAAFHEKKGDDADFGGMGLRLSQLIADSVAKKPRLVESLVADNPPDLTTATGKIGAIPEVQTFSAALVMRGQQLNPEAPTSLRQAIHAAMAGAPAYARWLGPWLESWVDDEGLSGDAKLKAKEAGDKLWELGAFLVKAFIALTVIWLLGMLSSVLGVVFLSPWALNIGALVVVVWRYVVALYDMPFNVLDKFVDFVDPTDGTGIVGGSVRALFNLAFPDREKTPIQDREPTSFFTDRGVAVAAVWGLLTAFGNIWIFLNAPFTLYPVAGLFLSGIWFLYFMGETIRKSHRRIGKHDEERYGPASWRMKLMKNSVTASGVAAAICLTLSIVLAITPGAYGSAMALDAMQQNGEQEVVRQSSRAGVKAKVRPALERKAPTCKERLPELLANADDKGMTVEEYCDGYETKFPCTCL